MSQEANASSFSSAASLAGISFLARLAGRWINVSESLLELATRRVSHKTANYTVQAAESGSVLTNLGASGTVTFTLPPATVGLHYTFVVRAAQILRVDPNGSETLETTAVPRVAAAAGKYIGATGSTTGGIGAGLHLVCLEAGKWAVLNFEGTWTTEP